MPDFVQNTSDNTNEDEEMSSVKPSRSLRQIVVAHLYGEDDHGMLAEDSTMVPSDAMLAYTVTAKGISVNSGKDQEQSVTIRSNSPEDAKSRAVAEIASRGYTNITVVKVDLVPDTNYAKNNFGNISDPSGTGLNPGWRSGELVGQPTPDAGRFSQNPANTDPHTNPSMINSPNISR